MMMARAKIHFRCVSYKNFLSTGNAFTKIQLDKSPTTLIVGDNGAGKSTMLDALCFGLFGKPFRNINKPTLVNSINGKDCLVEVEFITGNKEYRVVRGIKPNVFEIYKDGILINQDSAARDYQDYLEKIVLRLNYKSFTQIVVLGNAAFVPFMQLPAADRRAIIEDLLDIQIFSAMNSIAKERLAINKDDYSKIKYELDLLAEKIALQQKYIEDLKADKSNKIQVLRKELSDYETNLSRINTEIDSCRTNIAQQGQVSKDKLKAIEKDRDKIQKLMSKFAYAISKKKNERDFFQNNNVCPTCTQQMSPEFKHQHIETCNGKLQELVVAHTELETKDGTLSSNYMEISSALDAINALLYRIRLLEVESSAITTNMEKVKAEIRELEEQDVSKDSEQAEIMRELLKEHTEYEAKLKENLDKRQYFEVALTLLKDNGIKARIVKQYLPIINKLANKYLSSMGFFVNFNINENFEESILSRHRDNFSYENFSEGEKQRIDLALLFTWRAVAKMKNSMSTNILVLDEIFESSLDVNGTDEFLKLLQTLETDTNVFVLSPKGDILFDKFAQVIRFTKVQNFSRMM